MVGDETRSSDPFGGAVAVTPARAQRRRFEARLEEVAALADRYRRERGDEQSADESVDSAA